MAEWTEQQKAACVCVCESTCVLMWAPAFIQLFVIRMCTREHFISLLLFYQFNLGFLFYAELNLIPSTPMGISCMCVSSSVYPSWMTSH